MKIAVISTAAIPSPPIERDDRGYGGMERSCWWLASALAEMGHEIFFFAKRGSRKPPGGLLLEVEDSEEDFVSIFKDLAFDISATIDFSHDKVVSRAFPHLPIINTYSVTSISVPWNCVLISKGQRKHLARHLPHGEETPVIYYGLDREAYPLYRGERDDYLLYMGSILCEKRVHIAIEVAEAAGVPLKICGPGWQPNYLDNQVRPRLNENIEYLGEVGGQRKLDLIQKAKALIHLPGGTGWIEAGAIIALEALNCGTPVIVSNNGCLPEYVTNGKNGYIDSTIEGWIEAVGKVDKISPLECRASVSHFNKKRMAEEYLDLLTKMVEEGLRW